MSSEMELHVTLNLPTREQIKSEKLELKERRKIEKLEANERRKMEKLAEKERIKAEKLAEKERIKAEKLAAKEQGKAEKLAEKKRNKVIKLHKLMLKKAFEAGIKEGKKQSKINLQKKMQQQEAKFEIKKESITKLVQVARALSAENPGKGFQITEIAEKYIELHGKINPYSTELAEDGYDVRAAIRGIVYESSPSSTQHWFRFGQKKETTQICPWIFANKQLAIVNNDYEWRKTTDEMVSARRNCHGLWYCIDEPHSEYCWNEKKYGPLPTKTQLDAAEELGERVIGVRNRGDNLVEM